LFGKWQTASQPQQRIAHPLQLLVLESKSVIRMPAFIIQTMTHASFSAVLWFTTFEQVRQLISSSWMATLDRVPSPEQPRPSSLLNWRPIPALQSSDSFLPYYDPHPNMHSFFVGTNNYFKPYNHDERLGLG
jgi:hypothetical protein